MSKSQALGRTLGMINDLNQGKTLNITNLSYQYNVSTRTIRRDIEIIEEKMHQGFLQKSGENIYAVKKELFSNIMTGTEVASLLHISNVFRQSGINLQMGEKIENKIKQTAQVYDIKNKPLETMTKMSMLSVLEKAIKNSREINIKYKTPSKIKNMVYRPYKITMLNENFYLLGLSKEGKYYSLRVNMIQEVELLSKTFYKNAEMIEFVKNIQTPFAVFGEGEKEIKVKVDQSVSRYFKMKKFYKSQNIEEETEEGDIIVSYKVTSYREIEDFVIQWMPSMQIISPIEFKQTVRKTLKKKLSQIR